jgi:hypothetical protein
MGSNPIALTNEINSLYERLNIKSEPETSSGQRLEQHLADFVAGAILCLSSAVHTYENADRGRQVLRLTEALAISAQ